MKKRIKYSILFLMTFICLSVPAQNTASTSGNWDNCATWGNPASIFQNNTDTKTINTGINVTQNTVWSTNNVNFGTGNGSISFADNTKSIDFVNDTGSDKNCILPCPTPGSLAVSGAGNIGSCMSRSFVLTGTNISNANWTVNPTTGASPTSGTGSTANVTFNSSASGNYTVTFTANSAGGSCTTTTATQSTVVNVSPTADANFTASGSSNNSIQTNAQHAGDSNCFVTIGSGGFTYNVTGSYTLTGTIVITSAGGSNHEVRHNRYGVLATNVGSTNFTVTINRNAGDYDNYFWMYTAGGGSIQFSISNGKVHKN